MPNYAHGRIEDIRGRGYYSQDVTDITLEKLKLLITDT